MISPATQFSLTLLADLLLIVVYALSDGCADIVDQDVVRSSLILYVSDLANIDNQIVCVLLRVYVWWLDVEQNSCIFFRPRLVCGVFFEQIALHL